jgi:hypothetical protein
MLTLQKTQCQLLFSAIHPPTKGPVEGPTFNASALDVENKLRPTSGAIEYNDIAIARSSGDHMSPTMAPPIDCGAAPPKPARNRKTSSCVGVFAKPQIVLKTWEEKSVPERQLHTSFVPRNQMFDICKTSNRP